MKRTYIIDGYNLLYALGTMYGNLGPRGLERARDSLVVLLAESFAEDVGSVTVVFDAQRPPPGLKPEQHSHGIRILFASAQDEADDLIEELIALSSVPGQLVVVSSDHRLQHAAKRRQAHFLTCDGFLDHLEERRRPAATETPVGPEKKEHLSAEETKRWLEEFKDLAREMEKLDPY